MATTIEQIVAVLNEAYKADPAAMRALIYSRVPCNEKLADHPTIQVSVISATPELYTVGALGVINGIAEKLTGKRVMAMFDDADCLIGFAEWNHAAIS